MPPRKCNEDTGNATEFVALPPVDSFYQGMRRWFLFYLETQWAPSPPAPLGGLQRYLALGLAGAGGLYMGSPLGHILYSINKRQRDLD